MPFVCISNFVLCLVDVHAFMIVRLVQMNSWLNEVGVPKTNLHRSTTTQFSMRPGADFVGSHPEVEEKVDEIWLFLPVVSGATFCLHCVDDRSAVSFRLRLCVCM